jgi:hypothetical protein
MTKIRSVTTFLFFTLAVLPLPASAWNILGHMLHGIIAYQVLRQQNPPTIDKVTAVLEKHPWYYVVIGAGNISKLCLPLV